MSPTPTATVAKKAIGWSIGLSVLMLLAGILAIIVPPAAGIAVTIFVAWLLVFSGVAHFVFGWNRRNTGGLAWEFLLGVLYLFVGGYILAHPLAGLASLTLLLAIYLFVEALLELFLFSGLRRFPGAGWLLFDGIVTLVLAIMIWTTWPSSAPWAIGTLLGISMIFSGTSRLALSMAARRIVGGPS
ncbi:MAG: HdeD family acid-resistance protein [Thermoanaerobaculia bacterium]